MCSVNSVWLYWLTPLDAILLCHLPDGPTAHFKLTSYKPVKFIKVSLLSSCTFAMVMIHVETQLSHVTQP